MGERVLLTKTVSAKAQQVIACLHQDDASSRSAPVSNLLRFARRLDLPELAAQISFRLGTTRIGYSCHKEWVFQPLVRWFELLRKQSPQVWKSEGIQLLALDRIAEQQNADNLHSDELVAEVSAAAMACGPDDFETLFAFLTDRDAKCPLRDLASAARDGFEICLRERQAMSEESALARIAISIALAHWPSESPLHTVSLLLTAREVPSDLAVTPAWKRAAEVAADIQSVPPIIFVPEREKDTRSDTLESRSSEEILAELLQSNRLSSLRLRDVARLAERVSWENHSRRDDLIATALGVLESAGAFSRWVEFHDIDVISSLYTNLTESERWRLLGAMAAVTGEIRKEMHDANWGFMAASSAVNLMCRARAAELGHGFSLTVFQQMLGMHWKWHGVPPSAMPETIRSSHGSWSTTTRRTLLALTRADGCEPLYMVMCGIRFFAEVFPEQIAALCHDGLVDARMSEALLPLAQLWATRNPQALAVLWPSLEALESTGTLDDRLDAWAIGALSRITLGEAPKNFILPRKEVGPSIAFPGDSQLLEVEPVIEGLRRHNSFASMANSRLSRAGLVLGSMEDSFRYMVRTMRESPEQLPGFERRSPRRLSYGSNVPRPTKEMEHIVGDSILHQFAGDEWPPSKAAAVRLTLGYGMDPWIASSTPNSWPNDKSWPSDSDVERWMEDGAPQGSDVALMIRALIEGHGLASEMILLGAVLHLPTYRRDLEFRFWLSTKTEEGGDCDALIPTVPYGRTLANWLAGWSFTTSSPASKVSVRFVGNLINFPNAELEVTPTSGWRRDWNWNPDPKNALRFLASDQTVAAWYERWLGPSLNYHRTIRQPFLNRWIAHRKHIPPESDGLREWARNIKMLSGLLSRPE
jgi:hypothetical protein